MQLGTILATAPEAPSKDVEFYVLGYRKDDNAQVKDLARSCLVFVDEPARRSALKDAEAALAAEYEPAEGAPPSPIPPDARRLEFNYQFMFRALRDVDDPTHRQPFAASVQQLKNAVVGSVMGHLITAYNEFVDAEFPDRITAAALKKLEEQAAGESGPDQR
jgi:hypothetical protein